MRLIVAGGGTAGHTTPILAVLDELRAFDPQLTVLFIGSGAELERRLLSGYGIAYEAIPAGKYRRYNRGFVKAALDVKTNAQNVRDFFKTNAAYLKSYRILRKFKPDVVFIKGGFVGLPVGLAAKRLNLPIVLHDSDVVLGLTNKLLAKHAKVLATGFPTEQYKDYDIKHIEYVGNPLRSQAVSGTKAAAIDFFKLKEQKPNIFFFGGSRGAKVINDTVRQNISILTKNYNIIHVTGKQGIEEARFERSRLPKPQRESYAVYDLLENSVGLAYTLADVIVCRSGANTISELAHWGKPAILVPYESAANNEQFKNAQMLVRAGAARIMTEDELVGMKLVSEIDKLVASRSDRAYLSKKISQFAKPDAARTMAKIILDTAAEKASASGQKT